MADLIVRSKQPEVLEYPFNELTPLTSNKLFYVRSHFPTPHLSKDSWSLKLEGSLSNHLSLSYEEIMAMPPKTVGVTLECAGNNRIFLVPPVQGVQWGLGGVSSAKFTGVPLAAVLERAGLDSNVVDIIFEGADSGEPPEEQRPLGPIHFSRSLPLNKALEPDVLLAYAMNSETLTPQHGFPLRLIVPGWYAVASVKWLTRIVASTERFNGFYQSIDYAYWETKHGQPVRIPISEMLVKAQIASPQPHEQLKQDSDCTIFGAAWSGAAKIVKVEVSTDGGTTWAAARFAADPEPNVWCLWNFDWHTPAHQCTRTLFARATDANGNTQAMQHDYNRSAYMINHCLPIDIKIG